MKKKTLEKKRIVLQEKLNLNKEAVAEKQREGNALQKEINEIDKCLRRGNIEVSDHAVVRYLERVDGINIEEIRDKIVDSIPCVDHTEDLKDMRVLKSNHSIVVKDNVVVTIAPK